MKKIINGKRYNTETAKRLAAESNDYFATDFKSIIQSLYIKKTGEYFLVSDGGPMTPFYEKNSHSEWSGSIKIEPLTEEEARIWAAAVLEKKEFLDFFSQVEYENALQSIEKMEYEDDKKNLLILY